MNVFTDYATLPVMQITPQIIETLIEKATDLAHELALTESGGRIIHGQRLIELVAYRLDLQREQVKRERQEWWSANGPGR